MFKKLILSVALVSTAIISGCASVPMASKEADTAAKTFAAKPGQAGIYIYRNESMGAAIKMPVLLDGVSVGDTVADSYIFRSVAPGSHVITSKTENDATLTVDAKAGQNYFVWQEVKMGAWAAGSALHLVDDAKGKKGVNECELVK